MRGPTTRSTAPRVLLTVRHPAHRGGVVSAMEAVLPHVASPVTRLTVARLPGEGGLGARAAGRSARALRGLRDSHDLLHVNTSVRSGALARDLALLLAWGPRPAVAWIHGWDRRLGDRLEAWGGLATLARACPRLHLAVVGRAFGERVGRTGFPAARTHAIPVPFAAGEVIVRPRSTVLFLGRLVAGKGSDTLLEAFAAVAGRHPATRLVLAGEGPLRGRLAAEVARRGLEHRVSLPGWLGPTDKAAALSAAAVFALPSSDEGLPVALLEAMGAGVAPIVTAVGAIPEVVTAPDLGWLLDRPDPADLARALDEALSDPSATQTRGARAMARVAAHRAERVADHLDALWSAVGGGGSADG